MFFLQIITHSARARVTGVGRTALEGKIPPLSRAFFGSDGNTDGIFQSYFKLPPEARRGEQRASLTGDLMDGLC